MKKLLAALCLTVLLSGCAGKRVNSDYIEIMRMVLEDPKLESDHRMALYMAAFGGIDSRRSEWLSTAPRVIDAILIGFGVAVR